MAIFAILVTPIAWITWAHGLWSCVFIAGLALACLQGFAANVFGLADIFLAARIATAIGFAAFFGNIGGAAMAQAAGWLLEHHGSLTLFPVYRDLGSRWPQQGSPAQALP